MLINHLIFKKLDEYNKKLEKIDCFMLIQGSYADNSFLSYSDIDLVIIGPISKEISLYKKQIDSELKKLTLFNIMGFFILTQIVLVIIGKWIAHFQP